jgi:hypothetical protein
MTKDTPVETVPGADPEEAVDAAVARVTKEKRLILRRQLMLQSMTRVVSTVELLMMVIRRREQRCDFGCVHCCVM